YDYTSVPQRHDPNSVVTRKVAVNLLNSLFSVRAFAIVSDSFHQRFWCLYEFLIMCLSGHARPTAVIAGFMQAAEKYRALVLAKREAERQQKRQQKQKAKSAPPAGAADAPDADDIKQALATVEQMKQAIFDKFQLTSLSIAA